MKKLVMLFLIICTSVSIFAFDGSSKFGATKNNIGLGVGYQTQTLIYNNNSFILNGCSINFKREISLKNNANTTFFLESNLMLPFSSSISQTASPIDYSLVGVTNSDLFFFDFIIGLNYSSFASNNISYYTGAGLHSYYMFYKNPINSQNYCLLGFGLALDSGIQYYLNDNSIFEFATIGTFDFSNFKSVDDDFFQRDFFAININVRASIIRRF